MSNVATVKSSALAAALALTPSLAFAHAGAPGHTHGFEYGFLHPIGGIDHVLAMVAVGIFAATLSGRALWAVPATFVALMALGGGLGMAGFNVPFVELGIVGSIVVLGLAVALGSANWPLGVAMAMVGFFAIFHGHAHGAEMPADASGLNYAAGFMLATALLHMVGIGFGLTLGKLGAHAPRLMQGVGAVVALAGVGLFAGVI